MLCSTLWHEKVDQHLSGCFVTFQWQIFATWGNHSFSTILTGMMMNSHIYRIMMYSLLNIQDGFPYRQGSAGKGDVRVNHNKFRKFQKGVLTRLITMRSKPNYVEIVLLQLTLL